MDPRKWSCKNERDGIVTVPPLDVRIHHTGKQRIGFPEGDGDGEVVDKVCDGKCHSRSQKVHKKNHPHHHKQKIRRPLHFRILFPLIDSESQADGAPRNDPVEKNQLEDSKATGKNGGSQKDRKCVVDGSENHSQGVSKKNQMRVNDAKSAKGEVIVGQFHIWNQKLQRNRKPGKESESFPEWSAHKETGYEKRHHILEKGGGRFTILVTLVVSIGGMVELVPPFFLADSGEPMEERTPYSALELAGRDIYIREGCSGCHFQMIRSFRREAIRFSRGLNVEEARSRSGEYRYDRPFLWGSKRTGPDLWRESTLRTKEWHYRHFYDPQMGGKRRHTVMPAYPWLYRKTLDPEEIIHRMQTLNLFETYKGKNRIYLERAPEELKGKLEIDALVAYMMKSR